MSSHAKARTAGSTTRRAKSPGRNRIASSRTMARFSAVGGCLAVFVLLFSAKASADPVAVTLAGSGQGTVMSSSPAGIDCSNIGGPAGPTCSTDLIDFSDFSFSLAATPAANSFFVGWSLSAGFASSGCTTPPGNPGTCVPFLFGPTAATATFDLLPDPPAVDTGDTSPGARPDLALLSGTVNPGGAAVSECRFEYGETTEYGTTTPCEPSAAALGSGTDGKAVSASTEPLAPNTTYHYRLHAANQGGLSKGQDRTFTTGPAQADDCPNAAIRAEQGVAALLPDCMALEMVSPSKKDGHGAKGPEISVDGNRVMFRSLASLGGSPGALSFLGDPYIASRGSEGWTVAPTVPPSPYSRGWSPNAKAKSLTPDFSQWFQMVSSLPQLQLGVAHLLHGSLDGGRELISTALVPSSASHWNETTVGSSRMHGASSDHSLIAFRPGGTVIGTGKPTAYLPHDPSPDGAAADGNTYLIDRDEGPAPRLLARAQDKVWGGNCGTRVGGVEIARVGESYSAGSRNQGAISADGSLVYLSTRPSQPASGQCDTANKLRILKRVASSSGAEIHPLFSPECDRVSPPCSAIDGDDLYQGASSDQTKVYFTTNRQLVDTDLDSTGEFGGSSCEGLSFFQGGCDLYLYDSEQPLGQRLTQVSAGEDVAGKHQRGSGARVLNGTVAISGDGTRAYFVAEGVLTDDESPGGVSAGDLPAATPKLYAYHHGEAPGEELTFLGALDPKDEGELNLWGGEGTFNNAAYPVPAAGDGRFLFLLSWAPLTADDTDGSRRDLFRYDAEADQLVRVSKAEVGGSDSGPFDVATRGLSLSSDAPGTDVAEIGRWASEDGRVTVFQTAEGLLPGDVNGKVDSYVWSAGGLYRLPGSAETLATGDNRPTLSHDGATVAYQSSRSLLPEDGDSSSDIYVARAGGGFLSPEPDFVCVPGQSCQEAPPPAPPIARVGDGQGGNVVVAPKPKRCPKGKRKIVRKGKSRCVSRKLRAGAKGKRRGRDARADGRGSK